MKKSQIRPTGPERVEGGEQRAMEAVWEASRRAETISYADSILGDEEAISHGSLPLVSHLASRLVHHHRLPVGAVHPPMEEEY
jgi:hypothetical protein